MNKKVEIVVTDKDLDGLPLKYTETGKPYVCVDYSGNTYGGGCPCDSEEEINNAINHAKTVISGEGDKPVVVDNRKQVKLSKWFGG